MSGYKPKRATGSRPSHMKAMLTRKTSVLLAIRDDHGSAFMAAINGALNAEEFMKLENLSEH